MDMAACACVGHGCVAISPGSGQALQIVGPKPVLLGAEKVKVFPGKNAGVMPIGPRNERPWTG